MDVLIRLLLRFILVPLGAAAALVAAAAVIIIAHRNALIAVLDADPQAQQDYFIALLFAGPLLAALLSISAFYSVAPAVIGVLISEALAIRSWLFHAANGGLSAWLGWVLTEDIRDEYRFLTEPRILIAAGLLAGLVIGSSLGGRPGSGNPSGRHGGWRRHLKGDDNQVARFSAFEGIGPAVKCARATLIGPDLT